MADKKIDKFVHPGFNPTNFPSKPVEASSLDFSKKESEKFHMERDGNGIKIVSDGFIDVDALIQSEKCNAGLENIIRLQTMRYGTIQNAIARNADKQVFADVSKIPTSVAEQAEYVAKVEKDVEELCKKLGITKEQLLKSNVDSLGKILADKELAASEAAKAEEAAKAAKAAEAAALAAAAVSGGAK